MEVAAALLMVLALASGVLMLASLFTPRTAFFLKNKTKQKAILSWFGLAVVCLVLGGLLAPASPPDEDPGAAIRRMAAEAQAKEEASGVTPPTAEEVAARTATAQAEVKAKLGELDAMRNEQAFWELGFSVNNAKARTWKTSVEELRTRLEADKSLPVMLRAAPGALLMLGLEWQRNKGETTSLAKDCLEQIFQGLKDE